MSGDVRGSAPSHLVDADLFSFATDTFDTPQLLQFNQQTQQRHAEVFVYESADEVTTDSPSPSQAASKGEREGSIDTGQIALDESFNRFASSSFDSRRRDFSDSLSNKQQRQRYQVLVKSSKVGAGDDETESPLQKYERLKAEVAQLLSQINDVKNLKKESSEDPVDYLDLAMNAQALQAQLASANKDASEMFGLGSNAAPVLKPHLQADLTQQLFARLAAAGKPKANEPQGQSAVYELYLTPETKEAAHASRIADFDKRLSQLELVLTGNNTTLLENSKGLAGVLASLKTKVDALDEKSVEGLTSRIQALTDKYAQLQAKSVEVTGVTPQQEKKIDDLYKLVSTIETAVGDLPLVVDRLVQLKALHEESVAINGQWKAMDAEQAEIGSLLTSNRDLLQKMEQNLAKNVETIQKNVQVLESRFTEVAAKLPK